MSRLVGEGILFRFFDWRSIMLSAEDVLPEKGMSLPKNLRCGASNAMWLATKFGFYSIVRKEPADERDGAVFHVRARLRHDLENLLHAAGLRKEIEEWPGADYRYRFLGTEADVHQVMACLAATLDYNNFKSKIGRTPDQKEKLDAYHTVWSELARVQR